jgi:cysteinyl-tRNA synthetase
MAIQLYNTLTKQKEEFIPLSPGKVGFYACGPTVYNYFHIGNARAFIVFDVIRRYLIFRGYDVRYVVNLTDVDDKIIDKAKEEGTTTERLVQRYIAAYFEDAARLGIRPADVYPRATHHIPEIVALVEKLLGKGYAYVVDGDVYSDVSKFEPYGQLSGKNPEDLLSGARVAVDERKRNPLDFALWKKAKPGEPSWPSPWGEGRPGWHAECSAMSMKYLGETFDLHAGGVDLIFPHHENEIAQSEGATGKRFVRYWLHNGFLMIRGEKMSKSLGNFFTVREVLKRYSANTIRLFFLQKHYRSPIDFTEEALDSAEKAAERLEIGWENLTRALEEKQVESNSASGDEPAEAGRFRSRLQELQERFVAAMDDDFNTADAVGQLFEMMREVNRFLSESDLQAVHYAALADAKAMIEDLDQVLGVISSGGGRGSKGIVNELLDAVIQIRSELRQQKEWQLADKIRDELKRVGVALEDQPGGTIWRWQR